MTPRFLSYCICWFYWAMDLYLWRSYKLITKTVVSIKIFAELLNCPVQKALQFLIEELYLSVGQQPEHPITGKRLDRNMISWMWLNWSLLMSQIMQLDLFVGQISIDFCLCFAILRRVIRLIHSVNSIWCIFQEACRACCTVFKVFLLV